MKQRRSRGLTRRSMVTDRAYYTRAEACARYGFSAQRLKELIETDETLPMLRNGRNQLFPKAAMDMWYESAAIRRQSLHSQKGPY